MIYQRISETEFVRRIKEDNHSSLQYASNEGLKTLYRHLEERGEVVNFYSVVMSSRFSFLDYEDLRRGWGDKVADELGEASEETLYDYPNKELQPIFEWAISHEDTQVVYIDDEGAILDQ